MTQTTAKVSGMACSMCEAQINDTIRTAFRAAIEATGYTAGEIRAVPYEKKAIFHFGKKH